MINYDRAVPYTSSNNATSYSNNSWKVLGGGIESTAVDLAKFGWGVLNGEIIDETARDNRLWPAHFNNMGLAWFLGTRNGGRRIAHHNGSWTGARSYIRVYRDDDLVIAIMSNRTNHSVRDVDTLATTDLGSILLN